MGETIGMIPCHEVMARLWEYIDGELSAISEAEVQHHLELCEQCYPHYHFQRAYAEFMRQLSRRIEPAGLRRRIFQQLLQAESSGA